MRILAVLALAIFTVFCVGCTSDGVMLQPAQQGEWSNFKNDKHQVSADARDEAAKPTEKPATEK